MVYFRDVLEIHVPRKSSVCCIIGLLLVGYGFAGIKKNTLLKLTPRMLKLLEKDL